MADVRDLLGLELTNFTRLSPERAAKLPALVEAHQITAAELQKSGAAFVCDCLRQGDLPSAMAFIEVFPAPRFDPKHIDVRQLAAAETAAKKIAKAAITEATRQSEYRGDAEVMRATTTALALMRVGVIAEPELARQVLKAVRASQVPAAEIRAHYENCFPALMDPWFRRLIEGAAR
ncbi:MAG: hypothetical protein U1E65_14260 [Myxococcota bacterium]